MQEYKSSTSRLLRLFSKGREQWKQRAAEKQKKARALEIKVRDLGKSREQWKERARTAEKKLHQLEAKFGTGSKKKRVLI
jgi:predicted  nucleic acid-binding Zn-ribbon protein